MPIMNPSLSKIADLIEVVLAQPSDICLDRQRILSAQKDERPVSCYPPDAFKILDQS